jgi:aldose 1-epimerase
MGGVAEKFTLTADDGSIVAEVLSYGATIATLCIPDRDGERGNIVLGVTDYTAAHPYFGATVGRYANRIAHARFSLNGRTHRLTANDGVNALHGGVRGFSRRTWTVAEQTPQRAVLTYDSPDGEEGYPGALSLQLALSVTRRELRLDYLARAETDTIVNLTNHSYFNLKTDETILDHLLRIDADHYTPVDDTLIPTGEIASVAGTPFDFRQLTRIGARIDEPHAQLRIGQGYDHNWVLNGGQTATPRVVAELHEPVRGRSMTVLTTEPGLQFYAGCQLDGTFGYPRFGGLALETQHFPDSPNKPQFPSTVLRGGEAAESTTIWRFGTT